MDLSRRGIAQAVEEVSIEAPAGETVALVGESGCGKTTPARLVLLPERPTAGRLAFEGQDVTSAPSRCSAAAMASSPTRRPASAWAGTR